MDSAASVAMHSAAPGIDITEFLIRLGFAALFGVSIGFERQWRLRAAGMQTTGLVAVGAALFALLDIANSSSDTTRIVAGVVTGVGFIAGGVIFRSGLGVTGLNTAATMWSTAAVGALAGFGYEQAAGAAAGMVIFLNLVLQPLADLINARARRFQGGETIYTLIVHCERDSQSAVGAAILGAISGAALSLQSLTRKHAEDDCVNLQADIYSPKPDDARIEELSRRLLSMPGVKQSEWRSAAA